MKRVRRVDGESTHRLEEKRRILARCPDCLLGSVAMLAFTVISPLLLIRWMEGALNDPRTGALAAETKMEDLAVSD